MGAATQGRLRLLSYNIQAGIESQKYHHYLTRGWQSWLPHRRQLPNLDRVAGLTSDYDIVGLQEVDGGSLRSNFLNQTSYIANRAGFSGWHSQVNRNLGLLGQHSNGLLSRYRPERLEEHRLPGNLPGRGALLAIYGKPGNELVVCNLHLALGQAGRQRQLAYVADLISPYPHRVVMGDFNCHADAPELLGLIEKAALRAPGGNQGSFPSWRPMRRIDHILVSDSLEIHYAKVVDFPLSDHLPVALEVRLPRGIELTPWH